MGRHKGYKHTEEEKEKLRIARQKYLEKVGTVLGIREKDNKTEYMRAYQKLWRAKHPEYYRSRYKKKNEIIGSDMIKLQEIVTKFNEFQCSSLEAEYKTSAFNEDKMKTIVEDLNKLMNDYITELKQESEEKDECVSGCSEK
jgi:hypothetical protein